jgi:hypothetical protein
MDYTYKLSRDEVRGLLEHYKLIGTEWAEQFDKEMACKNDEALVYPKYQAPVVIVRDYPTLVHPRFLHHLDDHCDGFLHDRVNHLLTRLSCEQVP